MTLFSNLLAEFSRGRSDQAYLRLTSMLHWRPDSANLTVADLDAIYNAECHSTGASAEPARLIVDLIDATADACLTAGAGLNFENKVVLAIATRVRAERFIVGRLQSGIWTGITSNQTHMLIAEFKREFPNEADTVAILDRVALMTPENIHLNSFMYEPIIDMGEDQLWRLYAETKALT